MADVKGKDDYDVMPEITGIPIVPSGGNTGQVLTKTAGTDYNYDWENAASSVSELTDVYFTGSPSPQDGDILMYNDGSPPGWYSVPQSDLALTDIPAVQAKRTTNYSLNISDGSGGADPTYSGVITFNVTDVENAPDTLTHDPVTNSSRINILQDGLFLIGYTINGIEFFANTSTETHVGAKVILNGSTDIAGSEVHAGNYYSSTNTNSEDTFIHQSVLVLLNAGDYIEVQAAAQYLRAGTTGFTATTTESCVFWATRQTGFRGEQGPAGSGSTINVKENGALVSGSPFDTLNFTGGGVAISGAGSPSTQADITITGAIAQIVTKNITTTVTTSTTLTVATTPTSASGVAFNNSSITMTGASNKVRFQMVLPCDTDNDAAAAVAIVSRSTTVLAVGAVGTKKETMMQIVLDFYDTPGAGTHTYNVRVAVTTNNGYFNRQVSDATPFGGTAFTNNCNITLTEIVV